MVECFKYEILSIKNFTNLRQQNLSRWHMKAVGYKSDFLSDLNGL